MKHLYGFPAVLIGVAAITIVQYPIAAVLENTQIYSRGKPLTVKIEANGEAIGSGVILKKEGKTYYVLTNNHVVPALASYAVVTIDKIRHQIVYSNDVIKLPIDLAILKFEYESQAPYTTAYEIIGESRQVSPGSRIYIMGFSSRNIPNVPKDEPEGISAEINSIGGEADGYALSYRANTEKGMSGGPIFNDEGRLVGIHGLNPDQNNPGGIKQGIPMHKFFDYAPEACVEKGKEKLKEKKYQDAIPYFKLALSFKENFIHAYIQRGYAYLGMEDYDKAMQDANKAIEITPQSPQTGEAYELRGDIHAEQGKKDEACKNYNLAIQINKDPVFVARVTAKIKGNCSPAPGWTSKLFNAGSQIRTIAFNPQSPNIIASGSIDGKVRILDVKTKQFSTIFEHNNRKEVMSIAFSTDGTKLASGGRDGSTKVWDFQKKSVQSLPAPGSEVYAVAFSPHGELAIGLLNGNIQIRNLNNPRQRPRNLPGHLGGVSSLTYSQNGTLASSGADRTIKLWNLGQPNNNAIKIDTGHTGWIYSIAFSPDGETLVSSSVDKTIRIWDVNTQKLRFPPLSVNSLVGAYEVAISPDSKILASGNYKEIKLWDLANGRESNTLSGHSDLVRSIAFSPDGRLASGSEDGTIRIWEKSNLNQ